MSRGSLIVVSAPSGTGKSSIVRRLLEILPHLYFSVSATTRAPRAGERDGVDYHFLDKATFAARSAAGEFLEHAEVHGNCYGTLRDATLAQLDQGRDTLLEIDVQGAQQVKASGIDAHLVFILPPSREELERRLRERGLDAPDVIERRLAAARSEVSQVRSFDYVVVNDDLDAATQRLAVVVRALRCTRPAMEPQVRAVLGTFGLDDAAGTP